MPNHKSGSSVPYTLQRQKLQSDRIMVARTLLLAHLPCVFVTLYQPSNLHTKREFQISFKHPDHNPLACFSKDTRRNSQIYRTREAHIHFTATKEDQRNPLLKFPEIFDCNEASYIGYINRLRALDKPVVHVLSLLGL